MLLNKILLFISFVSFYSNCQGLFGDKLIICITSFTKKTEFHVFQRLEKRFAQTRSSFQRRFSSFRDDRFSQVKHFSIGTAFSSTKHGTGKSQKTNVQYILQQNVLSH